MGSIQSVRYVLLLALFAYSAYTSYAQDQLFQSDTILDLHVSGNLKPLLTDTSIYPIYYPQLMTFQDPVSGQQEDMSVELKTRGNFRRLKAGCEHLPLMLKFPDSLITTGTVFQNQRKLKLVLPCKGPSYVIREWLTYKIYNLINPEFSFKTRLVRIRFSDTRSDNVESGILGFIIENEKSVATRNKMILDKNIVTAKMVDKGTYLNMALFQFMVGNTDWSIPFLHNMKVMRADSLSIPVIVPYDFDHAGLVNAPYAIPPPPLELESVRERMYRGYCLDDANDMITTIAYFQGMKDDIINLIQYLEWIEQLVKDEMIAYLNEFFILLDDPVNLDIVLNTPCDPDGKGNIEIIGLGY